MARLFIVPVGARLLGLWAPLSAYAPFTETDRAVLLAGAGRDRGSQFARFLGDTKKLKTVEHSSFAVDREGMPDELFDAETHYDALIVICNGCQAGVLPDLLRGAIGLANALDCAAEIVASRDVLVNVLDSVARHKATKTAHIDLSDALEVVGVTHEAKKLVLKQSRGGSDRLAHVLALAIVGGELVACVDLRKLQVRTARKFYKQELLNWRKLTVLGLERRLVFCLAPAPPDLLLTARMKQDGFEGPGQTEKDWKTWTNPLVPGNARRKPLPANKEIEKSPKAGWTNKGPLVVALGPQASTTFQILWAHQAEEVALVVDADHWDAAVRLGAVLSAKRVTVVPFNRYGNNDPLEALLSSRNWEVNCTAGDAHMRAVIVLLALHHGREVWRLDNNVTKNVTTGAERPCQAVPLDRLLSYQCPGTQVRTELILCGGNVPADLNVLEESARAFQGYFGQSNPNLKWLDALWKRRELDGKTCTTDDVTQICLGPSTWVLPRCYDSFFRPDVDKKRVEPANGRWLELFGAALIHAHVDETWVSVRFSIAGHARDELDILSVRGGRLVLYSCKTGQGKESDFTEARAQADTLLGREATVVLLIPRVRGKGDAVRGRYRLGQLPNIAGLYQEEAGLGFLGDLRCLTRAGINEICRFRRGRV